MKTPMRCQSLFVVIGMLTLGLLTGCKRDATISSAARTPGYHKTSEPPHAAPFDLYRMRMEWRPEVCRKQAQSIECLSNVPFTMRSFAPVSLTGKDPVRCAQDTMTANPAQFKDLNPDPDILKQQWNSYGTCTGLVPLVYLEFAQRAKAQIGYPYLITRLQRPLRMQTSRISSRVHSANSRFPQNGVRIVCENDRFIAIDACFSKDLEPAACPSTPPSCKYETTLVEPNIKQAN